MENGERTTEDRGQRTEDGGDRDGRRTGGAEIGRGTGHPKGATARKGNRKRLEVERGGSRPYQSGEAATKNDRMMERWCWRLCHPLRGGMRIGAGFRGYRFARPPATFWQASGLREQSEGQVECDWSGAWGGTVPCGFWEEVSADYIRGYGYRGRGFGVSAFQALGFLGERFPGAARVALHPRLSHFGLSAQIAGECERLFLGRRSCILRRAMNRAVGAREELGGAQFLGRCPQAGMNWGLWPLRQGGVHLRQATA